MIKTLLINLVLASIFMPTIASSFSFPEIGFCPLGGPPGWFNRMTGQHDQRYYGPPPPMFRPLYPQVPAYGFQSPVRQQLPVNFPFNPAPN